MLGNEELMTVKGGSISGAVIEAAIKLMNSVYNLGRIFGSSIKRVVTKNYCS